MEFIDYYKELGVERGATEAEIRKAYRDLARRYHPDVNKDPGAEDRFKRVAESYEVLGDKERRAKYDQYGSAWKSAASGRGKPPPGFEGFDFGGFGGTQGFGGQGFGGASGFSDFFDAFFGRGGVGGARAPGPRKGRNVEAQIELSLEEAFAGGRREVTLTEPQSGSSKKYVVTIPPGVRSGQKIRLKGQGNPGAQGGSDGDLLLTVQHKPHARFRLEGDDLYAPLEVSPWVAALGGEAKLRTIDKAVTLTVPAGSSSGRKIRLKGKGFPRKDGAGDLYAEIRIMVPKSLSARERELFEELAETSEFSPDE